jgi:hypothetical protein
MMRHHSGEGEGLLEVVEALIFVGLGRLQDLLEEGVLSDGIGAPKPANPMGTRLKWRGFGKKLDPPGLMGWV